MTQAGGLQSKVALKAETAIDSKPGNALHFA